MLVKFFDANQRGKSIAIDPISEILIPLDYFQPFKPINLEITLPKWDENLEDDINFDLKLTYDKTAEME